MADDENKTTLKFIEDYRSFPQLWDQNVSFHSNIEKINEYLEVLATKNNMDIDGVKRKIQSLRSYFSKEHQKVIKNSGAGSKEIYKSPWFAYNHLSFIADFVAPRELTCAEEENNVNAETVYAKHCSTCMSDVYEDEHKLTQPERNTKIMKLDSQKEKEAYNFKEKDNNESAKRDEMTIYLELIAHKIRKLNTLNRLLAQQRINNILFDMEMEQLKIGNDES